jgi:hypothetical protein
MGWKLVTHLARYSRAGRVVGVDVSSSTMSHRDTLMELAPGAARPGP